MSYIVVFEWNESSGGKYGSRVKIDFTNKSEFNREDYPNQIVIAEDVTDDDARNLVCLAPEICHLMATVEQAHLDNPKVSSRLLFNKISTIVNFVIPADRERIQQRGLIRYDATKYIKHFEKIMAERPTRKIIDMQSIMMRYQPNNFVQIETW